MDSGLESYIELNCFGTNSYLTTLYHWAGIGENASHPSPHSTYSRNDLQIASGFSIHTKISGFGIRGLGSSRVG